MALADDRSGFGPRGVAFGRSMAEIPGHYRASLELYLSGDLSGAVLHASHPLMEVLPLVYEDLLEHELGAVMARSLARAASVVRERRPAKEVNAAFEAATKAGNDSIQAVVGPASGSPAYSGSVIAALLGAARSKYERAVERERVALLPEYQDAYGFIQQAQRMAEGLVASKAFSDPAPFTSELHALAIMVGGPAPPEGGPEAPDHVEAAVDGLRARLEREVGALLRETPTAREAFDRIEYRLALLADVLRHEETGRAEKLVARIYAEDYVDLAGPLTAAASQIHHELDPLLGRKLRLQIDRREAPESIAATVRQVVDLLERGISAIEEE
jgi:hypothetical protein